MKRAEKWRNNKRNREQEEQNKRLGDRIDALEKAKRLYVYCGLSF